MDGRGPWRCGARGNVVLRVGVSRVGVARGVGGGGLRRRVVRVGNGRGGRGLVRVGWWRSGRRGGGSVCGRAGGRGGGVFARGGGGRSGGAFVRGGGVAGVVGLFVRGVVDRDEGRGGGAEEVVGGEAFLDEVGGVDGGVFELVDGGDAGAGRAEEKAAARESEKGIEMGVDGGAGVEGFEVVGGEVGVLGEGWKVKVVLGEAEEEGFLARGEGGEGRGGGGRVAAGRGGGG